MARTLVDQRGSVGSVTYQGSRHGTIIRARVSPVNPQTIAQQNQRSILATCASEWRGLTADQRAAWAALAAQIGGNLTGFQAYTKINATRVTCGEVKLEDPPLIPAFGIMTSTGLTATDVPLIKLGAFADTVAPDKFMIEAAAPVSQGITNVSSRFRLISVVAGAAGPADLDISAAYQAKFGIPVATQMVAVRVSQVKDGFKGVPLSYRAVVT